MVSENEGVVHTRTVFTLTMQVHSGAPHAYMKQTASVDIGPGLLDQFTGSEDGWVPTIVNPSTRGGLMNKILAGLHIVIWVLAVIGVCVVNPPAASWMDNASNASTGTGYGPGRDDVHHTTMLIAWIATIAVVLGAVAILVSASLLDSVTMRAYFWVTALINLLTSTATVCTLYVLCKAAEAETTGYFALHAIVSIILVYAQTLLYCTMDRIDTLDHPRAFLASLAFAVSFVVAVNTGGEQFHCSQEIWYPDWATPAYGWSIAKCSQPQVNLAWAIPILDLIALAVQVGVRIYMWIFWKGKDGLYITDYLVWNAFLRAVVVFHYVVATLFALYKYSVMTSHTQPVATMFSAFSLLVHFSILTLIWGSVPQPNPYVKYESGYASALLLESERKKQLSGQSSGGAPLTRTEFTNIPGFRTTQRLA